MEDQSQSECQPVSLSACKPSAIQVAAAIIEHEGRYLVSRRKEGTHLGGFWEFPGGKRELNESLPQCLARELKEELSIEIGEPVLRHVVEHAYSDKSVQVHFFECRLLRGEPVPLGCDEVRWATPPELAILPFPPADQELIKLLTGGGVKR